MRFTLAEIATLTGCTVAGDPAVEITGADIDSRTLAPGELFVAVPADRDGHDFVDAAFAAGAAASLVSRPVGGGPSVVCADTVGALQQIGSAARDRIGHAVVAITGSVGKTSTKDLLVAACSGHWATHGSEGSFNNELGVPLTLVNAPDGTEVAVVEMGARGRGHIADLCAIARPDVGVITAVGAAHTELFGTLEDVAAAKGELVEALPSSGTAVLNLDDPFVAAMRSRTSAAVVGYGNEAAVRAEAVRMDRMLRPSFRLVTPWGSCEVGLAAHGAHMVGNALAAAAAALAIGTPLEAVAGGLGEARVSRWRMDVRTTAGGATVINDAYNANPLSMHAALDALVALPATRRIAVLGVMAELGDEHDEAHHEIGRRADELDIEVISVGVPQYGGVLVRDAAAAVEALVRLAPLGADDVVLVKGSRVAGLEEVANILLA